MVSAMAVIDRVLQDARRRRTLPPPAMRRYLRTSCGLTQDEIARALAVNRATVTKWEGGTREPRGELRLRYIELLERLAQEASDNGDPPATAGLHSSAEEGGGDAIAA